jgi:acetoin utilization deacetylase AcuC-like enzyme
MNLAFYYNPIFLEHVDIHSPVYAETPERLRVILEAVNSCEFSKHIKYIIPKRKDAFFIRKTHKNNHFEKIYQKLNKEKEGFLDPDTFFSDKTLDASLISANTGIEAARDILDKKFSRAFCCQRPPGHHAESENSMGYCLFNNIAITANFFRLKGFKKILIFDFDAHHGNGTQEIFYKTNEVLFISIHQKDIYPHNGFEAQRGVEEGEGFTINIPLYGGFTGQKFIEKYLPEILENIVLFAPEVLLFSAGFDGHREETISDLNFESVDFYHLTKEIIDSLPNKNIPILSFLEGGYESEPLAESILYHLRALLNIQLEAKI